MKRIGSRGVLPRKSATLGLILISFLVCAHLFAQGKNVQSAPDPITWHEGPYIATLGSVAQIKVPQSFQFADASGARRFLELTHNPPSEQELGIITPVLRKGDDENSKFFFVLFDFDDTGYVQDTEKSTIDADALLKSMQKNTEAENATRKERGWSGFHLTGWQTSPFYDPVTHNLTWGTIGHSDDAKEGESVNYATRILGRHGVMRVDLVLDPRQVHEVLPSFQGLLSGFSFEPGSRYADFVKGDRVAAYGLTALIAGGATAVALKTGLLAKLLAMLAGLWKLIAIAFAASLARAKNTIAAIKRRFGGPRSPSEGMET